MSYPNLPDTLFTLINNIKDRLEKLERSGRFTAPNVATDPTAPRKGDLILNTTGNQLKYVDNTGAFVALGASTGVSTVTATSPVTSSGGSTPNIALSTTGTAGTYTKVTTDTFGRVSSGTTLSAGDIPNIAESQVTNLTTDLAAKANLSGATFTGTVTTPTDFLITGSNTFIGGHVRNNYGNSSTYSNTFWDFQNEVGTAGAHFIVTNNLDGSVAINIGTTPPGSRTSDRRQNSIYISGQGYVSNSYQPAFIASNPATGNVTYGAGATIAFSTVIQNVGSGYNNSTYRFTAPVSGFYLLYFTAYNNTASTGVRMNICINGGSYAGQGSVNAATGNQDFQQTIIAYMNANDYATVACNYAGTIIYNAPGHTTFGGRLLG